MPPPPPNPSPPPPQPYYLTFLNPYILSIKNTLALKTKDIDWSNEARLILTATVLGLLIPYTIICIVEYCDTPVGDVYALPVPRSVDEWCVQLGRWFERKIYRSPPDSVDEGGEEEGGADNGDSEDGDGDEDEVVGGSETSDGGEETDSGSSMSGLEEVFDMGSIWGSKADLA